MTGNKTVTVNTNQVSGKNNNRQVVYCKIHTSKMVILPNKLKSKTSNFQLQSPHFKGHSFREQKVLLTDASAECDKVQTRNWHLNLYCKT